MRAVSSSSLEDMKILISEHLFGLQSSYLHSLLNAPDRTLSS